MLQAVLPLFAVISCDKHVPQEETGPVYTDEDIELDARIVDYINTSYASSITEVRVTEDKVSVSGNYVGKGDFYVAEISPVQDLLCLEEPLSKHIPGADSFTFEVDRFVRAGGVTYDRLLSKWAIFEVSSDGAHLVSAAHYADIVPALSSPAKLTLKNKKGMGGIFNNSFISDFDELGLGSATLNMYVTAFTYLSPGPGRIEHEYGGRKYYFDENYVVNNLDAMLLEAGKRNMLVAAILLVQPASAAVDRELGELLAHDGFTGGNLTLPDMTKPESHDADGQTGAQHGPLRTAKTAVWQCRTACLATRNSPSPQPPGPQQLGSMHADTARRVKYADTNGAATATARPRPRCHMAHAAPRTALRQPTSGQAAGHGP